MTAVVLLGPPGAGKGTQAARLSAAVGLPHISTGAILREAAREGTELGRAAREIMRRGRLVSDRIVLGIVEERVARPDCRAGFILDGYPRNRAQAEALDRVLDRLGATPRLVNIAVPRAELEQRLLRRQRLEGREDDDADAARQRFAIHAAESRPMLAWYGDRVVEVSGIGSRADIFARLRSALDGAAAAAPASEAGP